MTADLRGVRVRLLGGLLVEGIDEHAFGSRKARLLVKRLAIARGRPVSAAELIDVLWAGERPPTRPADQLGVLASRVRRLLGAEVLPHLESGYGLTVEWIDIDELEQRVEQATEARAAGRPGPARMAAKAALTLVRGPLLPDDDGAWLEVERARCDTLTGRAHRIVAECSLITGDAEGAAAAAESALQHDPYDESALGVLMRAHAAAGRPASGLAAYVRVRQRLAEDLGVDPTPETEAIHDRLVLGDLGGLGDLATASTRAATPAAEPSIVGRDPEWRALDDAFASAAAGASVTVLVRGEAGIGKSTLVEAWHPAAATRTSVIRCRCDPMGRDLPLQPVLDGVSRRLDALGAQAAADILGAEAPALAGLLGRTEPSDEDARRTTAGSDPELGRMRLFGALLAVVERLAGDPGVIVIEDVHDAGPATIEWISFAVRRGRRLLVIVTSRPGVAPVPGGEVIELGGLPTDALVTILTERTATFDHVDTAALAAIAERSGGNPLMLLALSDAGDDELPRSIRDAADRQCESLGEGAVTLRTAAIVGDDIDLDLLTEVTATPVERVLADLERAVEIGILVERVTGLGFRHELVREALDAGAGSARRAHVHRSVARALDRRRPRDPLAIAVHARLGGETPLAVDAFVESAASAFRRFDVVDALDHVRAALDLAPSAAAYGLRARIRMAALDLNGAKDDAAQAVALGGGASAFEISAWVAYYQRRYDDARAFADAGAARASSPELEVSCRAVGGRVRHGAGDLAGAASELELAGSVVSRVASVADVWLAHLRVHQGRPEEALDTARRALADPDRLAHPWAALHGRLARAMALGQLGRVDEALAGCDEIDEAQRRAGAVGVRFEGIAANVRGWLLRNLGCIELADESNQRALIAHSSAERLAAVGFTEAYWVAILDLVDGRLMAGDADGAARQLVEAAGLDGWGGTMAWHQRQRLSLLRARLALAAGDASTAWTLADGVRVDAGRRGARRYELLASAWGALADPAPDRESVAAVLAGLDTCARLEGWRLATALSDHVGVAQWRTGAERAAAAVIAAAGDRRDQAAAWVDRTFSAGHTM